MKDYGIDSSVLQIHQNNEGTCMQCLFGGMCATFIMPYFGKRKQVTKVTFCVQDQNVSVISTDINGISWVLFDILYLIGGWVFMRKIWSGRKHTK